MTKESTNKPVWLNEGQLAALVAPRTREVFVGIRTRGPSTVDEIQEMVHSSSKTIYYQVAKLVRAGLVTEVGSSKGARRERRLYEAVKGDLRMPEGYQGQHYERLAARAVTATLRSMIRSFNESARQSEFSPELVRDLLIERVTMNLTSKEAKALKAELHDIFVRLAANKSQGRRRVNLVCVMAPHESRL